MNLRGADATKRLIQRFESTTPQALLLTGPKGSGLGTLAKYLANRSGHLAGVIVPESASSALPSIKVERIRQLYIEVRSKMDGKHFIIIDDADGMNAVAQNALLKLLEEPNQSIHFILTTHNPERLLATIRSRTQFFAVPSITAIESRRLIRSLGISDESDERRLLYVAEGLPAELTRLATNKSNFTQLAEHVQKAREFVQGSPYQRVITAQTLKDDRQGALRLIDTSLLLLRRSLTVQPDTSTIKLMQRLIDASEAIKGNGNIRLQLITAALVL